MYAIVGMMKRPSGWTREKFRDWWLNEHTKVAKQLPGLRRYTVHPPTHAMNPVTGVLEGEPSQDGLAFLWFDDKKAAEDAFASKEGLHDRVSFGASGVSVIVFGTSETREILD